MPDDKRSAFEKIKDDLRQMADEVRLKVHLGGMEAKELWEKLEPKIAKFEQDTSRETANAADALTGGVDKIGAELKAQVEKLREKLRKDEPQK